MLSFSEISTHKTIFMIISAHKHVNLIMEVINKYIFYQNIFYFTSYCDYNE